MGVQRCEDVWFTADCDHCRRSFYLPSDLTAGNPQERFNNHFELAAALAIMGWRYTEYLLCPQCQIPKK